MSISEFINGFLGASSAEIVASFSGFMCLYLLIKRNIWCWFFGFIQVSIFTWVFYQAKLYSDAGLHVIYMGLQVYGWWNWQHHKTSNDTLIVERGSYKLAIGWFVLGLVATALLGTLMSKYTDASFPYPDAFTTSLSLVAQLLLTQRYIFNWIFWIIVDVVAIYIYLQKGLYPTATLYMTFLVMCLFGFRSWFKQYQIQQLEIPCHK